MTEVRIQRTILAPAERVYRAWLDPEVMQRWLAPRGFHVSRAEVDERVGGRVRVWHADDESDVGGGVGEIEELVPGRRLVLRWWFGSPDDEVDPTQETRLSLTFEPDGETTRLTLVHDRLDGLAAAHPEISDGVRAGWGQALDSLAVAQVLEAATTQALLDRTPLMRLAYTAPDGSPRVIPSGFVVRGTTLVMGTIPSSAKVSALRADPRVAVTIDEGGMPPCALLLRGTARVEVVAGVPDDYLETGRRTIPAEAYPDWERGVLSLYDEMAMITITPTWAKLLDFQRTAPEAVERALRAKG